MNTMTDADTLTLLLVLVPIFHLIVVYNVWYFIGWWSKLEQNA